MNPNVLAFFAALRGVLIAIGTLMVSLNLENTHAYNLVMQVSGAVLVVGPLAWGVFEKLVTLKKTYAAAVQAGINLVSIGAAVTDNGTVVDRLDGTTPPKPVTVETSKEIIKNFAPPPAAIAKK